MMPVTDVCQRQLKYQANSKSKQHKKTSQKLKKTYRIIYDKRHYWKTI